MKFRKFIIAITFLSISITASAQRFSVGSNAIDWLTFGTINAEASVAVAQHWSFHVGTELNPWTWNAGDQEKQLQVRQNSYWGGARYWPWHVYSGWWWGGDIRYTVYNGGGVIKRDTEEGDAFGAGAYGGYSIMLNAYWNLDLGVGVWGGWTNYTRYACPLCGARTDEGTKAFFVPDARVAIQFIF